VTEVSIVAPLYNEQDNVARLCQATHEALARMRRTYELVLVDDGSTDGTVQAAAAIARTDPRVRLVVLARNSGQTAAMAAGMAHARGKYLVTMDGDLQNDPQDIPLLVAKLLNEPYDLVAGWRQNRQDGFALRKFPSMLANRLIRRVTDLKFQDLGCSLKAFRAPVLREIRLYGEMHRFIPAWLATVTSPSRMAEVPVSHHARTAGESKYGISRTFRVLVDLLAVYFFLNFGARPGHFFGTVGLGIGAIGTMILSYLGVLKLLGESVGGRPLLILGFFMVIAGLQFLCTGVLAELLIRIYYEGGHARQYHTMQQPDLQDAEAWHGTV
jgi:glycosyltransferase involved in cell wall biosynthesis